MFDRTDGRIALLQIFLEPIYHYITYDNFYSLGPFEFTNKSGMKISAVTAKMEEPLIPEPKIDLTKKYKVGDEMIGWIQPIPGGQEFTWGVSANFAYNCRSFIDMFSTYGKRSEPPCNGVITYSYTTIDSPSDRDAEICLGLDYWAKIWVNGEVVYRPEDRKGGCGGKEEFFVPFKLKKGENEILLKLHAGIGVKNGFWFAISDPGDLTYQHSHN